MSENLCFIQWLIGNVSFVYTEWNRGILNNKCPCKNDELLTVRPRSLSTLTNPAAVMEVGSLS